MSDVSSAILGAVGIVFIILKMVGAISWPWLWVLAPFWLPLAIALGIAIIVGLVVLLGAGLAKAFGRFLR